MDQGREDQGTGNSAGKQKKLPKTKDEGIQCSPHNIISIPDNLSISNDPHLERKNECPTLATDSVTLEKEDDPNIKAQITSQVHKEKGPAPYNLFNNNNNNNNDNLPSVNAVSDAKKAEKADFSPKFPSSLSRKLHFLWKTNGASENILESNNSQMRELREFQVYGLFVHSKKTKVKFSPEVIQEANEKGDVAGKDRTVHRAKKRNRTLKKVMDSQGRIICDPDVMDDDTDPLDAADECCPCKCFQKLRFSRSGNVLTKMSLNYRIQAENFSASLDVAGNFLDGNLKTIKVAREVFSLPPFDGGDPIAQNVNGLGAKIWLFTYGLRSLFYENDNLKTNSKKLSKVIRPSDIIKTSTATSSGSLKTISVIETNNSDTFVISEQPPQRIRESEFQNLLTQFQLLGKECERVAMFTSTFYTVYTEFEDKITYMLSKILARLRVNFDTKLNRIYGTSPIWRRKMLTLKKIDPTQKNNSKRPFIMAKEIFSTNGDASISSVVKDEDWERFREFSQDFRYSALLDLVEDVTKCVGVIKAQMRFLLEDIVSGKFEEEDLQILNVLVFMEGVIKFFLRSEETSKYHEQNLRQVIRTFCRDAYELLRTIQSTVAKIIELRDTVQICWAYITKEFSNCPTASGKGLNLLEYSPCSIFEARPMSCILNCFNLGETHFYFKAEDFHLTPFPRILQLFQVSTSRALLILQSRGGGSEESVDSSNYYNFHLMADKIESEEDNNVNETIRISSSAGMRSLRTSGEGSLGGIGEDALKSVLLKPAIKNIG